uniref:N-acetyltransferase domain-containing protein n=1 Tax=Denticeps clupeoides TaxID=299321 RepID=A0AAY4ASM3_9TELE
MAGVQIRHYEEEDDEAVKELFTMGMSEHVPSSFIHMLRQPLTQMVCVCLFCILLASSKSIMLPVLTLTLVLAGGRQLMSYIFNCYIEESLQRDLNHVDETYMTPIDACFWVAESEGHIVGTVACLPSEKHPECLELKRMSVRRSHRGLGIAKTLCCTVAEFAQSHGFQGVVLYTSVVQTDAQRLYEHMGYQQVQQFVIPDLIAKLTNFSLFEYKLDLQPRAHR